MSCFLRSSFFAGSPGFWSLRSRLCQYSEILHSSLGVYDAAFCFRFYGWKLRRYG